MMDKLEHDVRAALGELADSVPPSRDAWAEHQRRLGRKQRSGREVAAVAVAAVAVLAVTALLPSALTRQDDGTAARPAAPGLSYQPTAGTEIVAGPFRLTSYVDEGQRKNTAAYVLAGTARTGATSAKRLCVSAGPASMPATAGERVHECHQLPDPDRASVTTVHPVVTLTGSQRPALWLMLARPDVASLRIHDRAGSTHHLRRVGSGGGFNLFLFEDTRSGRPVALDAYDARGEVIERGKLIGG